MPIKSTVLSILASADCLGAKRMESVAKSRGAMRIRGDPKIGRCQRNKSMDDLIKEFLIESNENLDRLDSELVKLESDPSSQDLLSSIFRTIHTIKGSCGFLGFSKLEKVAHAGESLLSRLRDGKISLVPELTSGLLSMVDAIRAILAEIQCTGQDGKVSYPELIETLNLLQQISQKQDPSNPKRLDSPITGQANTQQEIR